VSIAAAVKREVAGLARGALQLPVQLSETANIVLTASGAVVGATERDAVWTHRRTTLYRYQSGGRTRGVPILLVFALINRPEIFDLRPGHSFVEYLVAEGYDVFVVDWGVPGDEDAEMGVAEYVCDELHWAVRETLRVSGRTELTMIGWCIGATLAAMYTALHADGPVRNLVLLTMPVDTRGSLYRTWVGRPEFDANKVTGAYGVVPGGMVDWANKLMKPVANYLTTYRRLFDSVRLGTANRVAYQAMAKWVSDNPPFAGRAFREWITWMYRENRLVAGTMVLRDRAVDFKRIRDQRVLVVTAATDHIAPRAGTLPFLEMVAATDVTYFDRPGGHIGLMAGSKAGTQIWPDIAAWLATRSLLRPA
jgi:polyhydroxyalkanoate synthase